MLCLRRFLLVLWAAIGFIGAGGPGASAMTAGGLHEAAVDVYQAVLSQTALNGGDGLSFTENQRPGIEKTYYRYYHRTYYYHYRRHYYHHYYRHYYHTYYYHPHYYYPYYRVYHHYYW